MSFPRGCFNRATVSPGSHVLATFFASLRQASPSREPVMFNIDDDGGYPKITRPTSLEAGL